MSDLDYYRSLEDYEKIKEYLDVDPEGFEVPIEIDEFKADYSKAIIIDGLPCIGVEKLEKLLAVILKLYIQISDKLTVADFNMPFNAAGDTTLGFCFIKFQSKEDAEKAVQVTDGFQLSKTNIFKVCLYSDLQKYDQYPDEYVEQILPSFRPLPDTVQWLTDAQCRDQFVTRYGHETEVAWANLTGEEPSKVYSGEREKEGGRVWCESIVNWSPQGTYLTTYHVAGIKLWGNNSFEPQCRFAHSDVELADFSPCESYLITYKFNPVRRAPTDEFIICWNIRSGAKIRPFDIKNPYDMKFHAQAMVTDRNLKGGDKKGTDKGERLIRGKITEYNEETNEFTITEGTTVYHGIAANQVVALQEPNKLKWSSDGKYLARVSGDAISIYGAPSFALLDKKSLAAKDVLDFVWSPSLSRNMLSYWAPASGNTPSLVSIVKIPERTDLCSRKIFDVTDGKMVWQSEGEYLCVHMTKSQGKKKLYLLMFFRVNESGIPVEQLELSEPILNVSWEPAGDRVCIVLGEARNPTISFYSMSGASPKTTNNKKELTFLFSIKDVQCTSVLWSPMGEIIAIAFTGPDTCNFTLHDVENNVCLAKRTHDRGNRLAWDPSGRLLASCTLNSMKQDRVSRGHPDDGYLLFSFQGNLVCQVRKDRMYQFEWRPRPRDILSKEDKLKIVKNLKKYERLFEKEDKQKRMEINQEIIENRKKIAIDFFSVLNKNKVINSRLIEKRIACRGGYREDDDSNYVVEITVSIYE